MRVASFCVKTEPVACSESPRRSIARGRWPELQKAPGCSLRPTLGSGPGDMLRREATNTTKLRHWTALCGFSIVTGPGEPVGGGGFGGGSASVHRCGPSLSCQLLAPVLISASMSPGVRSVPYRCVGRGFLR